MYTPEKLQTELIRLAANWHRSDDPYFERMFEVRQVGNNCEVFDLYNERRYVVEPKDCIGRLQSLSALAVEQDVHNALLRSSVQMPII